MLGKERTKLMYQDIEEKVPFLKLLGLTGDCFDVENACIRLPWRDEFMGNPVHKIMHGGMISAILDAVGGFVVLTHLANSRPEREKMDRVSTIDLRVDYLLPGRGRCFIASGSVLRLGKKVAVTQMKLHNDEQELIAVGMATFLVG